MPIANKRKLAEIMASSSILPSPPTKIPNTAASSMSPSSAPYDIFLSFRGKDTRKNFTSHLFRALSYQGYNVFQDTLLKRGQLVSSGLLKAIEDSKLSIVVFSNKYADSRWCLDELVKIMECRRSSQQIVLPVFYDVEPSDVRNQDRHYAAAFTNHEQIHEIQQVNRWKEALNEAGNLSGLHLKNESNGDEADFIKKIVEQVADSLDKLYLHVAEYPVGIESHVQKLNGLLSLGTDDVRVVAIWGLGGLGKTTIAKAVFNKIFRFFKGSCFLADVRETASRPDGLVTLQEKLISGVLKQRMPKLDTFHHGIEVIKQRLWRHKVLVVLDDVDSKSQLKNLAINLAWLPQGSRVIVTTRDKSCVSSLDARFYEPKPLDANNSLNLFNYYAFGDHSPKEGYEKLSEDVLEYARGLPLVVETLGSYMKDLGTVDEWQQALERLKIIPPHDVQEKLKLSFDSLAVREKELFLDIVGFFIGMEKDFMFKVLADSTSSYYPKFELRVLLNRCLVKIDTKGKLFVHDVLRDMGRAIVHEESSNDSEKRCRLWHPEEVLYMLRESSGTKAIQSIIIELPGSNNEHVDINAFAKMSKLRLIRFKHLNLVGAYNSMLSLDKLKWLSWYGFALTCIPSNLDMRNLVALHLRKSRLRQLWKGTKVLNKLKFLDVSDSYFLTSTPDVSGIVNLEQLQLCNCKNLVEVHNSIKCLRKLVVLDLSGCYKLFEQAGFEVSLSNLWHLISSTLSWTSLPKSRVSNFLLGSSVLSSLTELILNNCNLTHLPVEIGSLVSLMLLDLAGNKFSSIPDGIKNLHCLQFLDVNGCCELKFISDLPNDLISLAVEGCQSLESVQVTSKRLRELRISASKDSKFIHNFFTNKEQVRAFPIINIVVNNTKKTIPHWFRYQGLGPFISFVLPQHPNVTSIRGWIVCVYILQRELLYDSVIGNVYNKTKDKMYTIYLGAFNIDEISMVYVELSKYRIVVEGGDEIDILFIGTSLVRGCGLSLVYNKDDDVEMDEQLVIQYSPDINVYKYYDETSVEMIQCSHDVMINLCNDEEDAYKVEYLSPVMIAWIKPMLHGLQYFDVEVLLELVKEIAAGGGHGIHNEHDHSQVYHIIANAFYSMYVKTSTNRPSLYLEAMEKEIKGYETA